MDEIQSVILTLDDGREVIYTGRVQIRPDEPARGVIGVRFTEPTTLPENCEIVMLKEILDAVGAR